MWRKTQKVLSTVVPSLILAVFLFVVVCFLNRWDSMTAVTLIPIWAWAAAGMIACLISWIAFRGIISVIVFCVWLLTGIAFSEETHGIVRELIESIDPPRAPDPERILRVVNVNAGGTAEGLRKAMDLDPDLVLVQEAPDASALTEIANDEFKSEPVLFSGSNHAILGQGELLATLVGQDESAIHARIRLPSGFVVDLTSVELSPCLPSPYLWRLSTWKELSDLRIKNRRQLRKSLGENQITRSSTGRIVSGGFNTPPGDDVFRPLESNALVDSFPKSGTGWGNTYPANYAALRFDQIWASPNLTPFHSFTRRNPHSNHRMVVTDFILPEAEPE